MIPLSPSTKTRPNKWKGFLLDAFYLTPFIIMAALVCCWFVFAYTHYPRCNNCRGKIQQTYTFCPICGYPIEKSNRDEN